MLYTNASYYGTVVGRNVVSSNCVNIGSKMGTSIQVLGLGYKTHVHL